MKMNRYEALLGVGLLLIAVFAVPAAAALPAAPAGTASQVGEDPAATGNDTADSSPAPGAQFSAAVDVHGAEFDGEMDRRTFGIQIAAAASNDSKAAVVGDRVQSLEDRLTELRDREQRLTAEYEAGNLSEARYRAEVTGLAARSEILARQANETRAASEGLPDEALAARGVDVDAIETIRQNASSMTGPEVAEIARTVGGPGIGGSLGDANRGPPADLPGQGNGDGAGSQAASTNRTSVGPPDSTVTAPGEAGPPGQDSDGPSGDRSDGSPEVPGS